MANISVQDHHLSNIRKERQNSAEFIEKHSASGTHFMIICLVYIFYFQGSVLLFFKKIVSILL